MARLATKDPLAPTFMRAEVASRPDVRELYQRMAALVAAGEAGLLEAIYGAAVSDHRKQHQTSGLARAPERDRRQFERWWAGSEDPEALRAARGVVPRGLDHFSRWRDARGEPVLIGQPYDLGNETLVELVDLCERERLALKLSAQGSWHYPGRTLLVRISRPEPGEPWIRSGLTPDPAPAGRELR
jgi:hypothetical protein